MSESEFRIPKQKLTVTCHFIEAETATGSIYLDVLPAGGYRLSQIVDYFNSNSTFFPLKVETLEKPILLSKRSILFVDLTEKEQSPVEELSHELSVKKEAVLCLHGVEPFSVTIWLDLPEQYSRLLDFFNMTETFFPVFLGEQFRLINSAHLYKIEEA